MYPYLQTFFSRVTFFAQKVIVSRRQIIKKVILSLIELHPFLRLFCVCIQRSKGFKKEDFGAGGSIGCKQKAVDRWLADLHVTLFSV